MAIYLSVRCSEYYLFDASLKVIRTARGGFASRHDAFFTHAHGVAEKQLLQFAHHRNRWGAVQHFYHVSFQRMKGVGPIDLLGILALGTMVGEGLVGWAGQ